MSQIQLIITDNYQILTQTESESFNNHDFGTMANVSNQSQASIKTIVFKQDHRCRNAEKSNRELNRGIST